MKFIADVMLGRLVRLMRFAGYDVEYDRHADDDWLLRKSRSRLLLTKDRVLASRATHVYFVQNIGGLKQIQEIRTKFPHDSSDTPRCLVCNRKIRPIRKSKIEHRVPPFIFRRYDSFFTCGSCNRVYWPGTHHERMMRSVNEKTAQDAK